MSKERRTREELLFELEQVKRADEDHFQSLLDEMEKIQAERDRLEAENAKLLANRDGQGTARTSCDGTASPSPSTVRDKASGSARHAPERAASYKEPSGRLTEAGHTHTDRDAAKEKAIAERRLRELAASGFRKRARSPQRDRLEPSQCARDPTPPRKERRRTSRSRSRTRSRDRQRPRSRGRDVDQPMDRQRQPRRRSDRDCSRERGQRNDQGRRRNSRSPQSPWHQSERPSPQPSQSPPRHRGKDVLALPGPAQAQASSAMTVLDPGFAEQLQSMVAPLAALGPALQGLVSMLQAVPAAVSSIKMEIRERDAQNQQELQHITKQNQELQDELSKVKGKIQTGSEIIDKNSRDVNKLKDRLEAEKTGAAERAKKTEASSKALHEQQAQTGKALASLQRQVGEMPSKSAVDPKIVEELTRLRKQVELLEAERQQRVWHVASPGPAAAALPQQDETGQQRSTADADASPAGEDQPTGSDRRQSPPGFERKVRKQHLPPVEPAGLADFAASAWGSGNANTLPPWLREALEHISCKPPTAGATWPSRPMGIVQADTARPVSAAPQHVPTMAPGNLQLGRQHPGPMQGVRLAGMALEQPGQASSAPIQPTAPLRASAAQPQKQQQGSSWPPKGPDPVQGGIGAAMSQGAPPWVQEAQRVSNMLTAQLSSAPHHPKQASIVPQSSQAASQAAQSVASLPAATAPATAAGPHPKTGAPVPPSHRYRAESPSYSKGAPSSSQAPPALLTQPLYSRTGTPAAEPCSAPSRSSPYVPTYTPAYSPNNPARLLPSLESPPARPYLPASPTAYPPGNPARQLPSFQGSPARPVRLASAPTGSPFRPAASMAQPSKPRTEASQQPSAAAAPGKASQSVDKGTAATSAVHPAAQPSRPALQQSSAPSGTPSSQGRAPAKQSAALAGTSMSQAHAKVHTADRPAQQMIASPPTAANLTGSAARQDSPGAHSEGGRGDDSRRVEAESKGQRRKRHREEAQQAAVAAHSPRPQQTPEAQSKRAKNHHEQAPAHQASAAPEVQAMPPLNADFICGICERAYSNSAALHLHLTGNEHQLKLSDPNSRQGKAGEECGSPERVAFRKSFPWSCKLCSRDFALMRQLVDHSSASEKHTQRLQAALRKSRDEAREEGEVAGFAPILSGRALRETWAMQTGPAADMPRQEAPESPSRLRVVALEQSTASPGSEPRHADQQEATGQAAKVDRGGRTEEGWQYESPQHAADGEGSRRQSREGSVEDGELPRVPLQFSLTATKTGTPHCAQPSRQPSATDAQKHSAAPSDKGAHAPAATSAPPGSGAPPQQIPAAVEKDSFLPPHLKGLVAPQAKAPTPLQSGPPQPIFSAAPAASKAAEKAAVQPAKQETHGGQAAKVPAPAHITSTLAKQPCSMPGMPAMEQASARSAGGANILQGPKAAPASITKGSAAKADSSAHAGQATSSKQAPGAAITQAAMHREAAEKGHRASTGAAAQQKSPPSSGVGVPGTAAAGEGGDHAGSTAAARTPVATSRSRPASPAKTASVGQTPAMRPAPASRLLPSGIAAPPISAAASAVLPTSTVPVPAEAIAAATSFLNDLGNANSSPSGASRPASSGLGSGSGKPAVGQLGSKSQSALRTQPGRSLPNIPANPPSPEMRLETLMQELSDMAHRLPNATPAELQQKPAASSAAASKAAASLLPALQQPVSRSGSPASGMPLRASALPRQPQQVGSATAARSAAAKQGRASSDADIPAAEKLRKEIAELQRVIDLKERETKRKGLAGKPVPQGERQPALAPQTAPVSTPPNIAKAKAEVPKASAQPSKGPSPAPNLTSKQISRTAAPVSVPSAAQGERNAEGNRAAEHTSKPAFAGLSTGRHTPQAAAPVPSPSAAQGKQNAAADGNRAAGTPQSAPGLSAGEARLAPAKAEASAAQKQHSSISDGAKLAPKQPLASPVSKGARAEGTQLSSSSRPPAPGPVPPSQAATPASVPQVQRSQPSAAPRAEHPAAKLSAQAPQPVKPLQMPSMSAPLSLKQADTSGVEIPNIHASPKPPTAHVQGGPAASSQQPVKATAVPTSRRGAAQPFVMPASAGRETVQFAVQKDKATRPATPQPSASTGAASSAVSSQAQPVMRHGTPTDDRPKERAGRPTAASAQPDTHIKVGHAKGGAASAEGLPAFTGRIQTGIVERPEQSAQVVAKQREHASSTIHASLEASSGRGAPHRQASAAAAHLQAGEDNSKPASPENHGSLPVTGRLPAFPLPVLALENNTSASSPPSSDTPAYTMLTQTPLGTGSAWPAATQGKMDSQSASIPSQYRKSSQLTATPERLSQPITARTAAGAYNRAVPEPLSAGQRAGAAGQTPRASVPQGRTLPSRGRGARDRVMTTGRRPESTPKRPSPPGMAAGAAGERSEAHAASTAKQEKAPEASAGTVERLGGKAGHMGPDLGTSTHSGGDVAKLHGHGGVRTVSSARMAGASPNTGKDSAVPGEKQPNHPPREQLSRERQRPSGTAVTPVSRPEAGEGPGSSTKQPQDTPAESEDMDIDIMTVYEEKGVSQVVRPHVPTVPKKVAGRQLQEGARQPAAGPGSSEPSRPAPVSHQTGSVAASEAAEGQVASTAPAASPATGTAPPQPAPHVGSRSWLAASEHPSPSGAVQPQKPAPAAPQLARQDTGSSVEAKAAPAPASMSNPAAAKPAALPPQPQALESRARREAQPPARAAPLTVQAKASTSAEPQAVAAPARTTAVTAQRKASEGLVPKVVQAPPKLAAPSLQHKKPLEALPKPSVAPRQNISEATPIKALHSPVTTTGQSKRNRSSVEALPRTAQAPASVAASAPSISAAPSAPEQKKAGAVISKAAPAVKSPAGAASLAKVSLPPLSKVPIPAPKQATPAISAQAVQAPAKYNFLYPQKEDSTAANWQKLSRFAPANRSALPAPKAAPPAQKVQSSRPGATSGSAGGVQRSQHIAGQNSVQGQSSKRVVTVSHEGHAGNGMAAKNPRFEFDSPEPGEMRMPLQMAPVPVHMHPRAPQPDQFPLLQDPSQGAPFLQDRPEDPRYLPRQDPVMEWFHPESMSMASLPQPWHVHEMQMSGHRGHPVEMQAQQRFGPPDGRLPHQTEERQQSMQNMHLPPMPMHMPPGGPMYNSQGHFPQHFLRDEGMGRSEHVGAGPGLPPNLGGPDFGRPHSQSFGMYGPQEQLPFPPQ